MTMHRIAALALLAGSIGLFGCGPAEDREAPEIRAAKEATLALLNDPASAQFRNLKIYSAKSGPVSVCGEVNAKNRMGGYNGFQKLYYVLATREAHTEPPSMMDRATEIVLSPSVSIARSHFEIGYMDHCLSVEIPTLEESEAKLKALNAR